MQESARECLICSNGIELAARAKINLCLFVRGRREDGYHDIETLMQSVSLHDRVFIRPDPGGISVVCDSPEVPQGEGNIAYRAASAIAAALQSSQGRRPCRHGRSAPGAGIAISKGIPVAAGLGGGSADAAAVLVGLNSLWELNLPQEKLRQIGEGIGADVPFCVVGGSALARKKGEELTPLPPLEDVRLVLAKPAVSVKTAQVYSEWDRMTQRGAGAFDESGDAPSIDEIAQAVSARDIHKLASLLWNDLEAVTFEMFPEVRRLKSAFLELGALGAVMSGSGPTVVGFAQDEEHVEILRRGLESLGAWVAVVKTVRAGIEVLSTLR